MKRELTYLIQFALAKRLQLSPCNNVQYEIIKPRTIFNSISSANENLILHKTYTGRELISILGGMSAFTHFVNDD